LDRSINRSRAAARGQTGRWASRQKQKITVTVTRDAARGGDGPWAIRSDMLGGLPRPTRKREAGAAQ